MLYERRSIKVITKRIQEKHKAIGSAKDSLTGKPRGMKTLYGFPSPKLMPKVETCTYSTKTYKHQRNYKSSQHRIPWHGCVFTKKGQKFHKVKEVKHTYGYTSG